jgi:hypothetical protein
MKLSPITGRQWVSIVKNALLAGASAFVVAVQSSGISKPALAAAAVAGVTAALKFVEKAFTQG